MLVTRPSWTLLRLEALFLPEQSVVLLESFVGPEDRHVALGTCGLGAFVGMQPSCESMMSHFDLLQSHRFAGRETQHVIKSGLIKIEIIVLFEELE